MKNKVYIKIDEITCGYIQYLNHRVNGYKEILTEVMSNKRFGLKIDEKLFEMYNDLYVKYYTEFQTTKDVLIEELFPVKNRKKDTMYMYTIDYMSNELIVEEMRGLHEIKK